MTKLTEEDVRRLVEISRESGLKIDDATRQAVEPERSPDFYLGHLSGILCVVTVCQNVINTLGEQMTRDSRNHAESFAAENLVIEAVQLITMRATCLATVAAESYLEAQEQKH